MKIYKSLCVLAAATAVTAVSCDNVNNGGKEQESYILELVNPADADIRLNKDDASVFTVSIKTDLKKDQLAVDEKDGKTWCDATITDAATVTVTPGSNFTAEDLTANFVISAIGIDGVTPLEFKVTRLGEDTDYTITLESDDIVVGDYGYNYIYPVGKSAADVQVTVYTNAAQWYASVSGYGEDWVTLDKVSGRNGESVTLSFSDNTGSSTRSISLVFDTEAESMYSDWMLYIQQSAIPATSVTVKAFDASTETVGEELATNTAVSFAHNVTSQGFYPFYLESDGGVDFKWAETGSSSFLSEDPNWVRIGSEDIYDENWNVVDKYYKIIATSNTTGEARSVDLVLTASGTDTEFFRFRISQSAE